MGRSTERRSAPGYMLCENRTISQAPIRSKLWVYAWRSGGQAGRWLSTTSCGRIQGKKETRREIEIWKMGRTCIGGQAGRQLSTSCGRIQGKQETRREIEMWKMGRTFIGGQAGRQLSTSCGRIQGKQETRREIEMWKMGRTYLHLHRTKYTTILASLHKSICENNKVNVAKRDENCSKMLSTIVNNI